MGNRSVIVHDDVRNEKKSTDLGFTREIEKLTFPCSENNRLNCLSPTTHGSWLIYETSGLRDADSWWNCIS